MVSWIQDGKGLKETDHKEQWGEKTEYKKAINWKTELKMGVIQDGKILKETDY